MKVDKSFTIEMSPSEVQEILKNHILKNQNLKVDYVNFQINTVYEGHMDQGTDEVTSIVCTGKLND